LESKLITSLEELRELLDSATVFAYDSETTGLDYLKDRLVGFSFSVDGKVGYYVPLRHLVDYEKNLDPGEVLPYIVEQIKSKKVLMFNKKFDLNMLQIAEGYDLSYCYNVLDVQAYVWLRDTDEGFPSLKKSAKDILKIDVVEFSDVVVVGDFSSLSPSEAYYYAAQDAVLTYRLFVWCLSELNEEKTVFRLDSDVIECFRLMEMNAIDIDMEWLREEEARCLLRISKLTQEIYQLVGYNFRIASNRDKALALQQAGVVLTDKTKGGALAVSLDVLEKIDHPLVKKMVELSKLEKYYNSYIKKLREVAEKPVRFNYFLCKVPCLTEKALVRELNKGFVSIKDVVVGDMVWTGDSYGLVEEVTVTDKVPLITVVFGDGNELTGTGHHPVLLVDGIWKGLADLVPGDRVVMQDGSLYGGVSDAFLAIELLHSNIIKFPERMSVELAQLLGFIAGAGVLGENEVWLHFNSNICLNVEKFYLNLFNSVFGLENYGTLVGMRSWRFVSTNLVKFFEFLEAKEDKVPDCIMSSSIEVVEAWLRGFYDVEGCVCGSDSNCFVKVNSVCSNRLREIALILRFLGINTRWSRSGVRDKNYELSTKTCSDVALFRDKIGFCCVEKMKLLKQFNYVEELNFEVVKGVKMDGVGKVYDMCIPSKSQFVANGIITHNTGRTACGTDSKNSYFAPLNVQSAPKAPSVKAWLVSDESHSLGWSIVYEHPDVGVESYEIEAPSVVESGFRCAFKPYKGHLWFKCDFCISPDAVVLTPSGEKQLKFVVVGDSVLTPSGFKLVLQKKFTGKKKKCVLLLKSGNNVICSSDHKFKVRGEDNVEQWKPLSDILNNDVVVELGGQSGIKQILFLDEEIEMCDIEVEDEHCYYANGILTHNCQEELLIAACLSGERVWLDALKKDEDLHQVTAKALFGEEATKNHRTMAKVANFCETNENWVKVANGWKRPADLNQLDKLLDRHGNQMEVLMQVVDSQPCIELELSNGIKCRYHEEHKLLVWNSIENKCEWKKVKEIQNDQIISYVERVASEYGCEIVEKEAYLAGMVLGDEFCRSGDSVSLCVSQEFGEEILACLPDLKSKIFLDGRVIYIFDGMDADVWLYPIKRIPDFVISDWSVNKKLWLLAGLLDASGALIQRNAVVFQSTNKELIHQVAMLCYTLGMKTQFKSGSIRKINKRRLWCNKKCKLYSRLYSLSIYDLGEFEIPCQLGSNVVNDRLGRNSNKFKVNRRLKKKAYRDLVKRFKFLALKNVLLRVFCRGNFTCVKSKIMELHLLGLDSRCVPVRVLRKRSVLDRIYALEVSSHEYYSSSLVSHNSILYGAKPYSFSQKLGISLAEAEQFFEAYAYGLPRLTRWRAYMKHKARKTGVVHTFFGRPRRMAKYYNGTSWKQQEFGDRTAVNTVVQGCLQKDARILTDHGYYKIKELYEGNVVGWKVWTGVDWRGFRVLNRGKAQLANFSISDGRVLKCDVRHEVRVHNQRGDSDFKLVVGIENYEQVCVNRPMALEFGEYFGYSSELYYWLGYLGDGWVQLEKGQMHYVFDRIEEAKADRCVAFFLCLGLELQKHVEVNNLGDVYFVVDAVSVDVKILFSKCLDLQKNAYDSTKIPEIVWRSSLENRLSFLKGFYDLAGNEVDKKIYLQNYEYLLDVMNLIEVSSSLKVKLDGPLACGISVLSLEENDVDSELDVNYVASCFKKLDKLDKEEETYTLSVEGDLHQFVSDGVISKNTAGDILRIVFKRLYYVIQNDREFREKVIPLITVHDEINFSVDLSYKEEFYRKIKQIMQIPIPQWEVQLKIDVEAGISWGQCYKVVLTDEGKLVPAVILGL